MINDIEAHLRRLVLAGLPLLAGGCGDDNRMAGGPTAEAGADTPTCAVRPLYDRQGDGNTPLIHIGFDREDPRWSDLLQACVKEALHCQRFCLEVLQAVRPQDYRGSGVASCDLGCDREGGSVLFVKYSTASPGRRPEGFAAEVAAAPGTSPATFWADCARIEGAAATAFEILEDELRGQGAPADLVARARAASQDERRHFGLARRLARRYGAPPIAFPRPARPGRRSLERIALENATEGCVAETYSAVVALWQSRTATDPLVARTMARIATDELAHAQLAWDVDAWVRGRLDRPTVRRLETARAEAGARLVAGAATAVEASLVLSMGLPDPVAARTLATALKVSLWS